MLKRCDFLNFVLNFEDEPTVTKNKTKRKPKQKSLQMSVFFYFWDIKNTVGVLRGIHYPPFKTAEIDILSKRQCFLFLEVFLTIKVPASR